MDYEKKFYKFLDKLADDEEFKEKWIQRNKETSEDLKRHLDKIEEEETKIKIDEQMSQEIQAIYYYMKQIRSALELRIINLEEDIKNISRIINRGA